MTSLVAKLARPEILALAPIGEAEETPDVIRLDANESPFPPLVEGVLAADLNRYPEQQPVKLKRTMAALYGVAPDQLVVTRGARDAVDLLIRSFCRPGLDAIAVSPSASPAYRRCATLQGARIVEAGRETLLEAARGEASLTLVFLASEPLDPAEVLRIAEALTDTIVVLDESDLDFSETPSLAEAAARRPNLVVLKSLSAAYGLAGARIGAAIGHAELIDLVSRALPPHALPTPSIEAALATLAPSRRPVHAARIAKIKADRDRLAELFATAPIIRRVRAGGNCLFLDVDDAEALADKLRRSGIRVRPEAGSVRLTIGTDAENEAALAAFGIMTGKPAARRAELVRDTKETKIAVAVDLDRNGPRAIATGIGFFDHMLDQVAAHGGFALTLACEGDLEIDPHHSLEDCAIALGAALSKALGDRRGIGRFGFALPMDETEAQVLIDLSGRAYSVFDGRFEASHIGAYPTEMTRHIFRSLADGLGAAIHVRVLGDNDHHKTEACFKALGRALRQAIARDGGNALPSTKGVL